ncbi:toxin-antitoxin system HicB family antitoxin [Georgenia sp. TF02-10]|uniref:toxin-antitoxin system HicB family antitoxin n=1 Tax=Georgenia sp. TF02-10 TaxID=2917725 RepID=UPI001FA7F82A|nr:toxin-antitoxin system HicB family antitoxin [Georgenia sp. TF02-10]UNX53164.1 toxin-antitoxin system HicB family antitoxin [Georgenia sp. TF02-10]
MDLTRYVDDLQNRLATAAGAGGEEARQLAERLTAPLDAAVRLVLLEALSDAAGEISAELAPGSVDVRLRGGDPELVVTPPAAVAGPAEPAASTPPAGTGPAAHTGTAGHTGPAPLPGLPGPDADAGATSRTTLRLPDHLKAQVELAAARDGISVNSWLVRAVAAALERSAGPAAARRADPQAGGTTRLTGWVR